MPILTRPTTLPTWAVQDVVDPVSHQNNVETPPDSSQQFGWAFQQYPPRNWFNWLGRWTSNWLAYLKQNDPKSRTFNTFTTTNNSDSDGPVITIPQSGLRPIVLIFVNNTASGENDNWFAGMATTNSTSSFNVNIISNNKITVGQIDKDTGILHQVKTTGAFNPATDALNIISIQYDSFF